MADHFKYIVLLVLMAMAMLFAGMYLLANFNRLFRRVIRNELIRKNVVVWMIAICLGFTVVPTNPESYVAIANHHFGKFFITEIWAITIEALFVFNLARLVVLYTANKNLSFRKRMAIILLAIIVSTVIIGVPINFMANNGSFINIQFTLLFNFYTGSMCGLIYITMSFVDLERNRKLNEKELELTRLRELKMKAELEALHSKINPHFLYNALNSIADLSVTDGRKARKMTVALADLFRYSINYSDHNYSTIGEEVEMAEVYLLIEKIRFEDKLTYTIQIDEEVKHYLVPRFVLQPIVENAVKHGLKVTGRMTEIAIEAKKLSDGIELSVADNGPAFPSQLIPGYGVKSIYDKLDLLFPGIYEVHYVNEPLKKVNIQIHKLMKNEPGL